MKHLLTYSAALLAVLVSVMGSSFADLRAQFFALCTFALFFNGWAVLSYKKTN